MMALAGSLQFFTSSMLLALKKSVGRILLSNMQIQADLIILSQKNLKLTDGPKELVSLGYD